MLSVCRVSVSAESLTLFTVTCATNVSRTRAGAALQACETRLQNVSLSKSQNLALHEQPARSWTFPHHIDAAVDPTSNNARHAPSCHSSSRKRPFPVGESEEQSLSDKTTQRAPALSLNKRKRFRSQFQHDCHHVSRFQHSLSLFCDVHSKQLSNRNTLHSGRPVVPHRPLAQCNLVKQQTKLRRVADQQHKLGRVRATERRLQLQIQRLNQSHRQRGFNGNDSPLHVRRTQQLNGGTQ